MSVSEAERQTEFNKYFKCYQSPRYRMGDKRKEIAQKDLANLPHTTKGKKYLDVSCGRGEMLDYAATLGYDVTGTEIVHNLIDAKSDVIVYAQAHQLPFQDSTFDVATLFDVIEHLYPGDDELACLELQRVCKSGGFILLTANNRPSKNHIGEELHINKRPYHEWNELFISWFNQAKAVHWLKDRQNISETWQIEL